ncbi:unnamed protein product, partial [Vitis vinifera]
MREREILIKCEAQDWLFSSPFQRTICSDDAVHVAMTLDAAYIRGSMAAILSVLQHATCPENVNFHFVASASADAHHLPTPLGDHSVLAAPEYCNANFTSYFTPTFWSNPSLSLTFADYTTKIVEWMELQKRMRIYELGSLPPFLLVFAGNIAPVDHKWNQHGLGGDNFRGLCRDLHPGPVSLLHWSGKGKPWARLDANRPCPLDALWAPYDLLKTPFKKELKSLFICLHFSLLLLYPCVLGLAIKFG